MAAEVRPLVERYRATRTVIAPDLPGDGGSDRSNRAYTPRPMTDALHQVMAHVRRQHGDAPFDALAVSLGCECLARAAIEQPPHYRTLALVSPTGFNGNAVRRAAPGTTRQVPGMLALLRGPGRGGALFRGLTRPAETRHFRTPRAESFGAAPRPMGFIVPECLPMLRLALLLLVATLLPIGAARAQPAARLVGATLAGEPVDLAALRGKVVLVFFWSTNCSVCMDKMPELRRNLEGWRGKDLVVLAISQDSSRADLLAYEQVVGRLTPPNPQLRIVWRRDPAHRDAFGELPLQTPTSVLIDRSGAVVKQIRGRVDAEVWDEIAELVLQ